VVLAYARGCLHACFMRGVPSHTRAKSANDPVLAAEIGQRAADLEREAENGVTGDARGTARAYRAAAVELWLAANALAAPGP
jgi:hypothetical protein